ncbi:MULTISPECIES: hypothetical protein [Serratia]|uniref:hypothetical protein n=1 Tax=Serratia TaxID=613 RepID=UPI0019336E7C|nr:MULTISPECIES: hypothetical protein [Serratia]WBF43740.1 hypothetical protein OLD77_13835 [Serratia rubidaea]CAE1145044.1 protein of unknown function [Serratia sp. Tan611]
MQASKLANFRHLLYGFLRFLIWILTFNAVLVSIIFSYGYGFWSFLIPVGVFICGCFLYWKIPMKPTEKVMNEGARENG